MHSVAANGFYCAVHICSTVGKPSHQQYKTPWALSTTVVCPQFSQNRYKKRILSNWIDRLMPSVLWRCWLGGRKGIWPVKKQLWGAGMVICLEWGADLHLAQLMPLPLTVSCFSKIQIGSTFLVPAHLGSPGKRAVKWVCVCVDRSTNHAWKMEKNKTRNFIETHLQWKDKWLT